MEWISVEDRLPKEEGFYITKFGDGFIGENWFLMFDDSKEPKWYHDESVLGGIKYWAETDFVQVVRCKDCDLWNEWDCAGHKETGNFVCSCAYFSNEDGYIVYTEPDDYCSKGERKEDEE